MQPRVDDQELAVASVYARSLLALAEARKQADEILMELEALVEVLAAQPLFAAFLSNPTVAVEARRDAVERTLRRRANDLLVNTLQVMNRRDRLDLVPALAAAYRRELDQLRGRGSVEVVTAVELEDDQRRRLTAAVERLTGRAARLVEIVDGSVIGGLVVKVGDEKIDTSVSRALNLMKSRLADRASNEIQRAAAFVMDSAATE